MGQGDRHSNFFRLFTRSSRGKKASKTRTPPPRQGSGKRITDPLGATRVTAPHVVHAAPPADESGRPELTVVRPPARQPPRHERHVEVRDRAFRFSLSYLAGGTLVVALCLLLLASFVLGMRYQSTRPAVVPGDGGDGTTGPPTLGLGGTEETGPPGAPAGRERPTPAGPAVTMYRLRIVTYAPRDRDAAEKSVRTLKENGVPAVLQRIRGRDQLVVYSEQQFAERSSAEATALMRKVQQIKQDGRYDFTSAYYVVVND